MRKGGTKGWKISFIPYYMTATAEWRSPRVEEAIGVLGDAGYDGVEWMLGHHFKDADELKKLAALTRKRGLTVSNIMCWQDLVVRSTSVRAERVKTIQRMVAAAGELQIPIVNVFTGPITWNASSEKIGRDISVGEAWEAVVGSLSSVLETAEKHGVVVTVEPVFGMLVRDYYTLRELLSQLDSKQLCVNIDPSHFALAGDDTAWAVRKLGGKIRHVHVKDVFGRPGVFGETFTFPFLGEGMVDWSGFFGALKEIDYRGFLSLEFENDVYLRNVCGGDWRRAAVELKQRAEKLLPPRQTS